jgi:hypothetical protein
MARTTMARTAAFPAPAVGLSPSRHTRPLRRAPDNRPAGRLSAFEIRPS